MQERNLKNWLIILYRLHRANKLESIENCNDFGLYLDFFFLINIVHLLFYIFIIQDLIYFAYFNRIQNKKICLKLKVIPIDKKIRVA